MRFSSIVAGVALALTISHALTADVVRWDNGQLIPGTEGVTPGPGVSLTNLNLQFAKLHNLNLAGSNFSDSDLTRARLDQSQLSNVNFSRANLTAASLDGSLAGVNFTDATIKHVGLSGVTNLTSSQVYSTASYKNKDLTNVGFANQNMAGWNLSGQNLQATYYRFSNLTNADLSNSNLFLADLQNVSLKGVNFSGANIASVDLQEATTHSFTKEMLYSTANYVAGDLRMIDFSRNDLSGWDFSGQNLQNVFFLNADLADADFTDAILNSTFLSYATGFTKEQLYSTASYQDKSLFGISLDHRDLRGWSFRDQDMTAVNLAESQLDDADFAGAIVEDADFSSATSRGFSKEDLYSSASYQTQNLRSINLSSNDLAGWNFSGQRLTNAKLNASMVTGADFSNAAIHFANLGGLTGRGFTQTQLYSTLSYLSHNLTGVGFAGNSLDGWNFSNQNLTFANFAFSTLTNADFTGADLRAAKDADLTNSITRNTIDADGVVHGLDLEAGESLRIVDFDSLIPEPFPGYQIIPVTIEDAFAISPNGALRLEFDADNWGSTIRFESGLDLQLQGTLELGFSDDIDLINQVGRTFKVFDWTGVSPTGQFDILAQTHTQWDLSRLYTTGEVTLVKVPEPSTIGLGAIAFAICAGRYGLRRRARA